LHLRAIRAHAMLHQANRARDDIGQIVADIDDYVVARELVAITIAESVGSTISDTVRQTVDAVAELAAREGVSVHAVTDKLQLDKSNAGRRLRVAADGGYVRIIGDPLPKSGDLLPDPAQLATVETTVSATLDLHCCSVAPESRRYRSAVNADDEDIDDVLF
jgi:hypothetical protein